MLKKNYKRTISILFLSSLLFLGFLFVSPNVMKNLCNINYPPMSFCKYISHIPFGF